MSTGRPIIAVTCLALEARIAAGPDISVLCGDARHLSAALRSIERGASGIISFGIAGGLAPDLAAGDWVVASGVVAGREQFPTNAVWARRLLGALPEAVHADIAGADAPVADPDAKRRLRDATGATAVDMESHVAARIAADYDIPLAACRVVIDPVHRRLPPAALVGLKPKGTVDFLAVLRSIAQRPSQLPALLGIAFEARAAQAALVRGRRLLGARLGFPQPGELRPRGTSCSMVYPGAWQPFRSANPFRGPAINA